MCNNKIKSLLATYGDHAIVITHFPERTDFTHFMVSYAGPHEVWRGSYTQFLHQDSFGCTVPDVHMFVRNTLGEDMFYKRYPVSFPYVAGNDVYTVPALRDRGFDV